MPKQPRKAKNLASMPQKPIRRIRDTDFVRRYANTVQVEATLMDFRIRFGEFEDLGSEILIREVVAISMSPQQAVNFSNALLGSVKNYMALVKSQPEEALDKPE